MVATIPEAIEQFKRGNFIIIVDDEERENEGDLVVAAEWITPEKINFMIKHAKGLVCMPIIGERLDALKILPMVPQQNNKETVRCNFTVSVDYRHGTSTGISAHDRAATIRAILDPQNKPDDFSRPGHVFPLRYRKGGVLRRAGHTEASVDLAKLANLYPASVICEIIKEDGTMARMPDLAAFSQQYNFPLITIRDLIAYRRKYVKNARRSAEAMR